jgi:hypothetical protein
MFKHWRWSWKIPVYKQIQKYTEENIEYYQEYLLNVFSIPMSRLKFMDEVSFSKKDVRHRKALSKKGVPIKIVERSPLNEASVTGILLTRQVLYY